MDKSTEVILLDIFKDLPRGGPGDTAFTETAFSVMKKLPDTPRILDIGCGPGMQTIDLIHLTNGSIIALDKYPQFLDQLNKNIKKEGLQNRINTVLGDMFNLTFEKKSFDIIWSEGAIYIIGFEQGLKTFKPFLKENGYIAVTEVTWLKPNPPADLKKFWMEEYPAIQDIESNLMSIKKTGYEIIDNFTLPEHAWWDDYYTPLQNRLEKLREKYKNNTTALDMINMTQAEINMYKKYSEYYGYVFYIMRLL